MAPTCGVCYREAPKYKCPKCEMRYCSAACSKNHKTAYPDGSCAETASSDGQQRPDDTAKRAGSARTRSKGPNFTGIEDDADFQQLFTRYPKLHAELQLLYGLTMEPGPDEGVAWRYPLYSKFGDHPGSDYTKSHRGRGGGFSGRGRGRGGRQDTNNDLHEDRINGPWSQQKGDQQATELMQRIRRAEDEELSEGFKEFAKLCAIKFGQ